MKEFILRQTWRSYWAVLFLLVLLCLPAVFSLFQPGFFLSDDGEWMIIRFAAFYQSLTDGQFPVRFLSTLNHGYGYPVANFLYPGFMYLGIPIKLLGFGFVDTIKIILVLSMIGSSIFCYLWLSKLFDKIPSLVGALFYIYSPYHLYDLYKRGSAGEVLALAIVPFILWQFERRSLFWSSIGFGVLILSHNTLAILFFGFFILYAGLEYFIAEDKKEILKFYIVVFIFGFLTSSFFWIPAILELPYTIFSQVSVSDWDKYFATTKLIGYSIYVIFILTFVFFVSKKMEIGKYRLSVLVFIIGIITLFFSTSISSFLWNILPVLFIQFPFRLLSITILCASFLAASIIAVLDKKNRVQMSVGIVLLAFLSSIYYIKPSATLDKGEGYYSTNQATTTVQDEYTPVWVKEKPQERFKEKVEIVQGEVIVSDLSYNSKEIEFSVDSKDRSSIRINTIYYPGWNAFLDGKEVGIDYYNKKGTMNLKILNGEHNVKLEFSEIPLRLFADFISLFSFIFLIIFNWRLKFFLKVQD